MFLKMILQKCIYDIYEEREKNILLINFINIKIKYVHLRFFFFSLLKNIFIKLLFCFYQKHFNGTCGKGDIITEDMIIWFFHFIYLDCNSILHKQNNTSTIVYHSNQVFG